MKYAGIFKPKISRKFPVVQSPSLTSELVMISRAYGNDNETTADVYCDTDSEGAKLILVCSMIVCFLFLGLLSQMNEIITHIFPCG